jgi:hypothetical protein
MCRQQHDPGESMLSRSLKGKLLAAVFAFVVVSGLVIALLMSQRYSSSLRQAMLGQAENVIRHDPGGG